LHISQITLIEQETLFKDTFNQKNWKKISEDAGFGCKIRNRGNLEIMIYPDIRAASRRERIIQMGRKHILIVDDERDVVSVLAKGLTAEGYSVITAFNGINALALAKSEGPDLIILDILMPDMDGPEVAVRLKEDQKTSDIPVIFLTGMFPKREDIEGDRIVAGYRWLDKPYDILKLITVIEEILSAPAAKA